MKKEYIIKRAEEADTASENFWDSIPKLAVDCFIKDANGYRPKVEAAVVHTTEGFHVYFKTYENFVTAKYHSMNEPVYKDSCVEFFLNPKTGSDGRYLNFEINAIGTLLLGFGGTREQRVFVSDVSPELFKIKAQIGKDDAACFAGPSWTIRYFIPFSYLEKCYGKLEFGPGYKFEGNFYKCGDETRFPHFASWNPITGERLSFHKPECFGTLIME